MVIDEDITEKKTPRMMLPANIDNIMDGIGNTGSVKMNNHRKKLRQRFDIIKKLGQGTYGKVQLGINKETGQEVAIKTIKKCKIETEADLIRIRREVQIMSSVQHPNIIHIYEVFENRDKMVLVMEFAAGGELYDYLSERKILSELEARRVFRQISTAVYYCHKHKICHRDLKLENILLDEHGNAKIADFGLSNVFDDQILLGTFCGSPLYASPEIVKGTPYKGPEVDCWSLGVLLYTLVYGAMPFDGSNFKRLVKQISHGDYYEPKKPSDASPLIREMLTVCPERRATIEVICNHWWVNEGYQESCLELAEELANQTPVRLDVLLSLSPLSVKADQLVVPTPCLKEIKSSERVTRSHSVGSVIDIGNTEAERKIINMVASGGEAALMPSPTRIMPPLECTNQIKRKLVQTESTDNATGAIKKKEKPYDKTSSSEFSILEEKADDSINNIKLITQKSKHVNKDEKITPTKQIIKKKMVSSRTNKKDGESIVNASNDNLLQHVKSLNTVTCVEQMQLTPASVLLTEITSKLIPETHKSRIMETAEKFQNLNNQNNEKNNTFGGTSFSSVGNFKKELERKASLTRVDTANKKPLTTEKKILSSGIKIGRKTSLDDSKTISVIGKQYNKDTDMELEISTSKCFTNYSLDEARRSLDNSIALLNQAKDESNHELDQLCAKADNVSFVDNKDRESKLKNAREVIGNALPGRLVVGVRKPPVPFGINGRSISGSVLPSNTVLEKKLLRVKVGPKPCDIYNATYSVSSPEHQIYDQDPLDTRRPITEATLIECPELEDTTQISRAEITLKSTTLPRRKSVKSDVKIEIDVKPNMRFSTEMQHTVSDLRSAPIKEYPCNIISTSSETRSTSLEPQSKELIIPIKIPSNQQANPLSYRSASISCQSSIDSHKDTTHLLKSPSLSLTTTTKCGTQPIKKSPREFIIPITFEGGGFLSPRDGSLDPSESNEPASFNRKIHHKNIRSILNDNDHVDPFQRLSRHTSVGRDSDNDEPRFHTMHRLRSSRPLKRVVQDTNDSASSGDDDDEDAFEILTAENLFSTLLSRVRALTNRLHVNNDASGFPSTRLMSDFRKPNNSFWDHDPFGRY